MERLALQIASTHLFTMCQVADWASLLCLHMTLFIAPNESRFPLRTGVTYRNKTPAVAPVFVSQER